MSDNRPRKLPTFTYQGKVWTVDGRLGEFRHVVFGEMLEFVPFDNERGLVMLNAMSNQEKD
jgi:hypothetical protein